MIHNSDYLAFIESTEKQTCDPWRTYAQVKNYPVIEESALNFLETWARLTRPTTILELGCGYGLMSARLLALLPEMKLTGIDYNSENYAVFKQLEKNETRCDRFTFKCGNVIDLLPKFEEKFDWVIVDVDKKFYPEVADVISEKVKTGGYLIADNVLWKGWVAVAGERKNPEPIRKWNELLFRNQNYETLLLQVGDGLSISRKL
ncbi:MAG: methyltransferase domain-containing protein [Bacteroidetes bacterium]|nr:methyltransferase domain-containing protein [Bacteroidota bacterium]